MSKLGLKTNLHLDRDWMWRVQILDGVGRPIAVSTVGYFSRKEALQAISGLGE